MHQSNTDDTIGRGNKLSPNFWSNVKQLLAQFDFNLGVHVNIYPEPRPDWSWVNDSDFRSWIESGEAIQATLEVSVFDTSGKIEGKSTLDRVVFNVNNINEDHIRYVIKSNYMVYQARKQLETKLSLFLQGIQ